MTNAELIQKIRAEIERLIKHHDSLASNAESEMIANLEIGAAQALDDILPFLSTLDSEKPINQEGWKEELEKTWLEYECYNEDYDKVAEMRWNEFEKVARHFAKWGAEHAKKDEIPVPADLEEAAENYSKERAEGHILYDWVHAFIAGAKWQKEQMLKEAVEKPVCLVPSLVGPKMFTTSIELSADELQGFNFGDKVRVIVLPKED